MKNRIRVLAPDHRASHRESAQAREHQQMHQRLRLRAYPRGCYAIAQLRTGQRTLVGQGALDDLDTAWAGRLQESQIGSAIRDYTMGPPGLEPGTYRL